MAKDLASGERSTGLPQNAEPTGPSVRSSAPLTPGQQRAAPFTRYWQKPAAPTSSGPSQTRKSEPRVAQPGASSTMDVFQSPISSNAITTIEILKTDEYVVELQSSDEDEVVEVALPPKPTITIESSDEEPPPPTVDNVVSTPKNTTPPKEKLRAATDTRKNKKKQKNKRRAASASPVPSVVSSISDDFIRGDCAAYNISRRPQVERFNFNLHGADLLDQHSNSLSHKIKKKKKKSKDKSGATTPTRVDPAPPSAPELNQCFTTPESNAKRKSKKSYTVSERSIPDPDVYESDSNQSTVAPALNTSKDTEKVTDIVMAPVATKTTAEPEPPPVEEIVESTQQIDIMNEDVELIENPIPIEDNLVMGNVTGLTPVTDSSLLHISRGNRFRDSPSTLTNEHTAVSQQTPTDGESQGIRTMHISRRSCREEMERFYNESWGGEDFDHYKILREMPRDKNLWTIDRRDRMLPSTNKRQCHYCNQVGHSFDRCRLKPRVCHMCGSRGHYEPRCPNRMCLRCGAPNSIYSIHCRMCSSWNRICCDICKMFGHPVEHCPDLWRRYHNTVENNGMIIRQTWQKKKEELFCSGCTRRGHLVHSCRSLPFSNLPLLSPFVSQYTPVYPPSPNTQYPTVGPSGRYFTLSEESGSGDRPNHQHVQDNQMGPHQNIASHTIENHQQPAPAQNPPKPLEETLPRDALKRPSQSSNNQDLSKKRNLSSSEMSTQKEPNVVTSTTEKNEAVLQDSEVSNTSEVVTMAKIYIEKVVMEELKKEGMDWLVATAARHRVQVVLEERPTTFVNISGLPADQEAFQTELQEWVRRCIYRNEHVIADTAIEKAETKDQNVCKDIPQNKYKLLRMLNQALTFLQSDLGDPKTIYKELQYLTKLHNKLLKKKIISPKKLRNSRQKLSVVLKNLNTILLGQAGLAGGSRHVRELYSLQEILSKYRKHDLPYELRHKVGEHFHFVFSTVARDDYRLLMGRYYQTNANKPSDKPKTLLQSPEKKAKLTRKQKKKNNLALAVNQVPVVKQAPLINQTNSNTNVQPNNPLVGTKEYIYMVDQMQSFQKKLRKESDGDEEIKQRRHILLRKLSKFQKLEKRGDLTRRQCVRLKKVFTDVRRFIRN